MKAINVIWTIMTALLLLIGVFCCGVAYQQDVEKGYYEELQKEKNKWHPKELIMFFNFNEEFTSSNYATFPVNEPSCWYRMIDKRGTMIFFYLR
jgi:hypothetical protein